MRSTSSGIVATTLAKMMIDMPWPMPRWVMSSPSHMTNAVPAVNVRMMKSTLGAVKSVMRRTPVPVSWPECKRNTRPEDCIRASETVR